MWPSPITLKNDHVMLYPLANEQTTDIISAAKDGKLWENPYAEVSHPDDMHEDIQRRRRLQEKGEMLPFVVVKPKTERVVGMTTYCRVDNENKRLDIGYTWYAKSVQGTVLNTACKLLLLTHAFETLGAIAVGFRVDSLNYQSQQAVLKLGAKLDGIIRNYTRLANGDLRDMHFYSILPHEWPHVKTHLHYRLNHKWDLDNRRARSPAIELNK